MKKTRIGLVTIFIFLMAFAGRLHAYETIASFSQQTIDGRTFNSRSLKGMPMVINVGSAW